MEDSSDREFERFIAENTAGKWFCGFSLTEKTPDFTTICKFRNSIKTHRMEKMFKEVKKQLQAKNYCHEVFTFVDSSALISKLSLWEERDKAITAGYEKLNNEVLPEVSSDPEAKIGAVLGDKGMIGAIEEILRRGLHPMIILRNNMKDKNPELDRWITKLRCPYERVFSKQNKRVRYKGTEKNQGAEFLYAMAFNFRRLLKLEAA